MPAIFSLLIPSLVPMFTDAVRGIVAKFTGGAGAQPQNVEESIKLMEAETKKMQALAVLDQPIGNVSPWVSNLRASCRYIIAIIVVVNAVCILYIPGTNQAFADLSMNLAGSVWAFLFGERMYLGITRGKK
jgi:hypothetical protein